MKFIHIGDLHLGKTLGEFDLYEDQQFILRQIADTAKAQKADAVLIAGDVYDKSVPVERAVRLLDEFLTTLHDMGIKVFLISGNHDSEERLRFGSSFFEKQGIYISTGYDRTLCHRQFEDEFGKIHVYLMPYLKASVVRQFFPEEKIDNYDDAVRIVLKKAGIKKEERNILVAHQFVAGRGEEIRFAGSENISVRSVGAVEQIGADCFDDFDYVALGHIHSAQRAGREEVRYCGSPLKYSASEIHSKKTLPVVTICEKGNVSIDFIPLKPMRDFRAIKGELRQLLKPEHIVNPEDYILVTLTDENPVSDCINMIRQYYPNTVKLIYENSHTREIESTDIPDDSQEKSFRELFGDFYRQIYGCEMSEEEWKVMEKKAEEAGIK